MRITHSSFWKHGEFDWGLDWGLLSGGCGIILHWWILRNFSGFLTVFLGRFFHSEENETYCPQSQTRHASPVQVVSENPWTCLHSGFARTRWKYGFSEQLILLEKMLRGGSEVILAWTQESGLWLSQAIPPTTPHTKAYTRALQIVLATQAL